MCDKFRQNLIKHFLIKFEKNIILTLLLVEVEDSIEEGREEEYSKCSFLKTLKGLIK